MKKTVKSTTTFGKAYYGCFKRGKGVMISVKVEDDSGFKIDDLFFTTKQAEDLYASLGETIAKNKRVAGDSPVEGATQSFRGSSQSDY